MENHKLENIIPKYRQAYLSLILLDEAEEIRKEERRKQGECLTGLERFERRYPDYRRPIISH